MLAEEQTFMINMNTFKNNLVSRSVHVLSSISVQSKHYQINSEVLRLVVKFS